MRIWLLVGNGKDFDGQAGVWIQGKAKNG